MPAAESVRMERQVGVALALVEGAPSVLVESALFEEMLVGFRRQQLSRRLGGSLIEGRERTVRRFQGFTDDWPWGWRAEQLERWVSEGGWAHSTVRNYQGAVAAFCSYVIDPRYGWVAECEQRVGARPSQICHEDNTATHVADYEGRPERRPLSRVECQGLFDAADDRAQRLAASGRKGWLTAFRDATLFKVTYGWGLRCREVTMLDLTDFTANPAAQQLGGLGVCHVRFGKAMRGSPPRRRAVASVMPWAVEALEEYLTEVRPRFEDADPAVVWPTERGGRISTRSVENPVRALPGGGWAAGRAFGPLSATFLRVAPDRGRRRSVVRATAGGALVGIDDGHLHDGRRGREEQDAALRVSPGVPGRHHGRVR